MTRIVRVTTGSRLHFGLMTLADSERAFAGVGAMVDSPALVLTATASDGFMVQGELAPRIVQAAEQWKSVVGVAELPRCEVKLQCVPPQHTGLGVGTQLALATVAAMEAFAGLPLLSAAELAACSGRGKRSAVGTHGFVHGGLVVDGGKRAAGLGEMDCRIDVPSDWRFVLVRPQAQAGLAGEEENSAIAALPKIEPAVAKQLLDEVNERMIPAAATRDFATFAASLYRYGYLAGLCFAAAQQGPYNGPVLTAWVDWLRAHHYAGVVQSSWGPTLAVVCEDQKSAEACCDLIRQSIADQHAPSREVALTIARPLNTGARIEILSSQD